MSKVNGGSPFSFYPEYSETPVFSLKRVSLTPELLVTYFHQALDAWFGFSEMLMEYIRMKGKTRDELSTEEIMEALGAFNLQPPPSLYHFGDKPRYLFTRIQQVSFEKGGLLVLELYCSQVYELYTAQGRQLLEPCHDLELLSDGKYLFRGASAEDVFRLAQVDTEEESWIELGILADGEYYNLFNIGYRDRLEIEVDSSRPIRIENFMPPQNPQQAENILRDPACNWITSPELVKYYRSDLRLAKIAVSRFPLAYSLLTDQLKHNSEIIRTLCLESDLAYHGSLNSYLKEWKIDAVEHLSASEIVMLIDSERLRNR